MNKIIQLRICKICGSKEELFDYKEDGIVCDKCMHYYFINGEDEARRRRDEELKINIK